MGNCISEEEQNRIINTLQKCVRQFGLSVKKGGEQEEESELLSTVENFRRELNLLLPYLQTFEDLVMATSQTAAFWNLYLKLVLLLLDYVSAKRDSNILLHLEIFAEMLACDFICNHQNYARWGSVYIAEMHKLQTDHMDVFQNFLTGNIPSITLTRMKTNFLVFGWIWLLNNHLTETYQYLGRAYQYKNQRKCYGAMVSDCPLKGQCCHTVFEAFWA